MMAHYYQPRSVDRTRKHLTIVSGLKDPVDPEKVRHLLPIANLFRKRPVEFLQEIIYNRKHILSNIQMLHLRIRKELRLALERRRTSGGEDWEE